MQQLFRGLGRLGVPLCTLFLLARCGGSDLTLPSETAPSDLALIDGNNQNGAAGEPLAKPIVVKVTDRRGQPVPGQKVAFALVTVAPGAEVVPDTAESGANGTAEARWTLGSVSGVQRVVARLVGLGLEVSFDAAVGSGGAFRIEAVSGDDQSALPGAELPEPLVVRLVDSDGNGVPDRPVSWVVGEGGGQVESSTINTDGDGEASTRWTLGSSGTNTLNAVVSGVGVVSFTALATNSGGGGGEPARLEFRVQPSDTREKRQIEPPVEVVVLDRDGNRVTNQRIEVKLDLIGDDDGELKGDRSERTESGVARFTDLKVEKEGDYRLRASADGVPSVDSDRFEVQED